MVHQNLATSTSPADFGTAILGRHGIINDTLSFPPEAWKKRGEAFLDFYFEAARRLQVTSDGQGSSKISSPAFRQAKRASLGGSSGRRD